MIYKFKAAYTKSGVGTAPSSAPVCTVVDSANNVLANAQATAALANLPGVYLYSYTGAAGLDLVALFHTTDATMDQQDLYSYTSDLITTNLDAPISTVDGIVDTITANVTTILADYARRTGDYSTAAALATVDTVVDAIKLITDQLRFTIANQVDANALSGGSAGAGVITWLYNLLDILGAPIADATVWVTSDIGGTHVLASGLTDAYGNVTFYLDAGTVYIWSQKSGFNFINPDTEVVS